MENMNRIKRYKIGVLTGGGSAPGINSVIHAVTLEAYRNQCDVFGIYNGFKNLIDGELNGIELTPKWYWRPSKAHRSFSH